MVILALTYLSASFAPAAPSNPTSPQERFRPAIELSGSLEAPGVVEAGDFNGDGHTDLILTAESGSTAVTNPVFRSVQISFNRGGIDFTLPTLVMSSDRLIRGLDSADIDGDGDRDLLILTRDPSIEAWLNDGHGSFTMGSVTDASSHSFARDIEIVDVDRDGILDVVLTYGYARYSTTAFSDVWFRRDASGQLSESVTFLTGEVRSNRMRLADIDGDGDLDVVASFFGSLTHGFNRKLTWFENTNGFPIDTTSHRPVINITGQIRDVVALDVDMDGDLDLAASVWVGMGEGRIRVTLNQGGGVFASGVDYEGSVYTSELQAADLNGDGAMDLLSGDEFFPGTFMQLSDGAGALLPRELVSQGAQPVARLAAVDLDGDALPEIIETAKHMSGNVPFQSSGVRVFPNLTASGGVGAGRFALPVDISESFGEGPILVADFNQDGKEDLLVQRTQSPPYVAVKLADDEGRYMQGRKIADLAAFTGTQQAGATVGDVNGDGLLDVAFMEPIGAGSAAQIGAVYGDGQGQFSAVVTLSTWPLDTDFVELHDLDGDGDLDLIGAQGGGAQILYGLNDGAGVFSAPVALGVAFSDFVQFKVVDLDEDGAVDVLTLDGDRVEAFMGTGTGSPAGLFDPRTLLAQLPWEAETIVMGDFDGDSHLDLAVLETPSPFFSVSSEILTFMGSVGGGFSAPPVLSETARSTNTLKALDVNGDGRDDLVAFGSYASREARSMESVGDGSFDTESIIDLGQRTSLGAAAVDVEQDGDIDLIFGAGESAELVVALNDSLTDIGSSYCVFAIPNSTGVVGVIEGYGGSEVSQQRLELTVVELPANVAGFFLASRSQAITQGIPGSMGVLCLGGDIGRFVGPGQVQSSGLGGTFLLDVDLMAIPAPQGAMSVLPGDTWYFQAWHRDNDSAGQATSNFSDALAITFR